VVHFKAELLGGQTMSMHFSFGRSFFAMFIAAGASVAAAQSTTQPSDNATQQQQINDLRSEVQQLRDQINSGSANPQPANAQPAQSNAEPTQTTAEPAPTSTEPTPNGFFGLFGGWNPDRGFEIKSADDNFLFHPWAYFHFRYAVNYRSATVGGSGSDTEAGFELSRLKLIFDGNLFTKDLTYQIIYTTLDNTGGSQLQDAWARYHIPRTPFAVEAGNIRDPLDHEQIMFATKTMTPERSIVNNVLLNGDDIVKGIMFSYNYDQDSVYRQLFAVTSGERNFDTDFEDYPVNPASWGLATRADFKVFGNWKDYAQFSSLGDTEPLLVFGGGLDYTEAGSTADLTQVLDVQYNLPCGFGLYAAYLGRYTRNNHGPLGSDGGATPTSTINADTYDTTVRFMASQLIGKHLEPFFRYEYIQFAPIEVPPGLNSTLNDITIGANYYFYGQRLKFSGAASYLPNGSPVANQLGDLLISHRGTEWIVQLQLQLMI
jgi:hypothetical protein